MQLPEDWEMLQFSKNFSHGQCLFADRHQFRFEFNWKTVPAAPDMERMLADYRSKMEQDGNFENVKPLSFHAWPGIECRMGKVLTTRLGAYFKDTSVLVELVFLWPKRKDEGLMLSVLNSFAPEPPAGNRCHWVAFGMDLLSSQDLELRKCTVKPGQARMTFGKQGSKHLEVFQRLGLVEFWLKRTVAEWLLDTAPAKVSVENTQQTEASGHPTTALYGQIRPKVLLPFRRVSYYEAQAWICPSDQRLYSVSCSIPSHGSPECLTDGLLSCCNVVELERGENEA